MSPSVVASSCFMWPKIGSSVIVDHLDFSFVKVTEPCWFSKCSRVPRVFSALHKHVKRNRRILRSRARSIQVFSWPFSGHVRKALLNVCEQANKGKNIDILLMEGNVKMSMKVLHSDSHRGHLK